MGEMDEDISPFETEEALERLESMLEEGRKQLIRDGLSEEVAAKMTHGLRLQLAPNQTTGRDIIISALTQRGLSEEVAEKLIEVALCTHLHDGLGKFLNEKHQWSMAAEGWMSQIIAVRQGIYRATTPDRREPVLTIGDLRKVIEGMPDDIAVFIPNRESGIEAACSCRYHNIINSRFCTKYDGPCEIAPSNANIEMIGLVIDTP